MPTSTAALRAAIHDALTADAALVGILGGPKIYDEPPAAASLPYVTLGETRVSDFSAGEDALQEHQLTLHAWSRQGGHKEANLIAGAVLQALDDAPLAGGHQLANLRFRSPISAASRTGAPITRWCASAVPAWTLLSRRIMKHAVLIGTPFLGPVCGARTAHAAPRPGRMK
jgi:hypothetical protein